MIRALVEHRLLTSAVLATVIGTVGRMYYPWPTDNALIGLLYLHNPTVYQALAYTYTLLWYTTPWFASSFLLAGFFIFIHNPAGLVYHALPPYPAPATRAHPFLILGEQHYAHSPVRAPEPTWLTIPERGLFTGVIVIGAIGTGKTSACLYPFAEQLLGWAADDPDRRSAGLVMEVKGDFCRHIRSILARHGRGDDYIEISLDGEYCYNPMYGDIEPFAIAYSIATLINQLYGRSKEPFWQQAYTHATRSVITAAQLADGYVTLASLYEYCISLDALEALLARARARQGGRTLTVARAAFAEWQDVLMPLATWSLDAPDVVTAAYSETVATALTSHTITFEIVDIPGTREADSHERIRAVDRWYREEWLRLEPRLRTSIVEGIAVFLGLFDDDPRVKRTFCPPHRAYVEPGSFPLTPLPRSRS